MNFKVKCVDGFIQFTTGKIYQVKNGKITDDKGRICGHEFKNIAEINDYYNSQFELYQEPKQFTKADLRSGDWCTLRDGSLGQVMINDTFSVIVYYSDEQYYDLEHLSEDLRNGSMDSDFDIVKVVRPIQHSHFLIGECNNGKSVFDRYPTIKLSITEAKKQLSELHNQNVEIVEDEI